MKRAIAVFLTTGAAVLLFAIAQPAQGQTVNTQVTLSCNDGHSVIFEVDQTTLTSLLADVQAINASGTGTSCTLTMAAIDPSSKTTKWTVYDYNPSNQAIAPRNSPNSMPATTSSGTTTFQFKPDIYTALLTTTDPSLTGDLSMKTLSDTISVSGDATSFKTQHGGGGCDDINVPAAVRFYFTSPSASGPGDPPPGQPVNGLPPAGFYTAFWWSNPANVQLLVGNQGPSPIMANMADPTEWSDWDGKPATDPLVTAAFIKATQNVQAVACHLEVSASSKPASLRLATSPVNSSPARSVRRPTSGPRNRGPLGFLYQKSAALISGFVRNDAAPVRWRARLGRALFAPFG